MQIGVSPSIWYLIVAFDVVLYTRPVFCLTRRCAVRTRRHTQQQTPMSVLRRVHPPRAKNNWLLRHTGNVTSQCGEDGIIEKVRVL